MFGMNARVCPACLQESKEATNYYFCYRWLLILFKREFSSYEEVCIVILKLCPCGTLLAKALPMKALSGPSPA